MKDRVIKFRVWDKKLKKMFYPENDEQQFVITPRGDIYECNLACWDIGIEYGCPDNGHIILMQYTGLKDRNGKEIYELMELDNKYIVIWIVPRFCLIDIANGDIVKYENKYKNKYEITKEYSPLSKNQERYINEYISQTKGEE